MLAQTRLHFPHHPLPLRGLLHQLKQSPTQGLAHAGGPFPQGSKGRRGGSVAPLLRALRLGASLSPTAVITLRSAAADLPWRSFWSSRHPGDVPYFSLPPGLVSSYRILAKTPTHRPAGELRYTRPVQRLVELHKGKRGKRRHAHACTVF